MPEILDAIRIRQSEIKAWKLCKRNSQWQYRDRLVRKNAGPPSTADLGTLVHSGLEAHYAHGQDPVQAIQEIAAGWDPYTAVAQKEVLALASIMLRGYVEWVTAEGSDVGLTITGVERQIEVPFGSHLGVPIIVTGKADLEAVDAQGRNLLIDHKTVDAIRVDPIAVMDDQRLTYAVLRLMEDGTKYDGALHNQLRRVKRTARANPPFYDRQEVTFNLTHLRNHYRHMVGVIRDIVSVQVQLAGAGSPEERDELEQILLPPTPTRDCSWRCPYLGMCPLRDDGSDWEWYRDSWYTQSEEVVH